MPKMDFDRGDRQLAALMVYQGASLKEQKAARRAQDAYNQKLVELQQQGLSLQADQLAKQYALQQAQLEWDKESFREQFGADERQRGWERAFQEKQAALDNEWRTAEQTGFRGGVPTLQMLQFNEEQRQFNVGQERWASEFGEDRRRYDQDFGEDRRRYEQDFGEDTRRYDQGFGEDVRRYDQDFGEDRRRYDQDFGERLRQFNVGSVLNAPRGPADWAAYTARLRGLQGSGALPGGLGEMFGAGPVASFSSGGQRTGPVLSNTDLALAATGQGDASRLVGTPWQGIAPGAAPRSDDQMVRADRPRDSDGRPVRTLWQGIAPGAAPRSDDQMVRAMPARADSQRPMATNGPAMSESTNPYSEAGRPRGGSEKVSTMLGYVQPRQEEPSSLTAPSMQKFRRFAPTEQAMGLGYLAESGGPTEDDARYLMERQAPQFRRSSTARYAGL